MYAAAHGDLHNVPLLFLDQCVNILFKFVFCRVPVCLVGYQIFYRTHKIAEYGYGSLAKLAESLGTGIRVFQNLQCVGHGRELVQKPIRATRVYPSYPE